MAEYLYKTRGNSSPKNKPRVYFTCHPDDFSRYFEKICEDIFKTHDCAIYYTDDMTTEIEEENKATDLGQMNLFVIPVTFRLLTTPNRAMDSDFAYAMKEHIPVLPIMMESGIDEFYSRPDKFGELQYINPYSHDVTEISYEEKLKKYLESVLISDEMAKRVRAAFDAYIFLSYRKKDRRYANELMRLIHAKPECRDIAIWYDEYLTPGESFNENISRMLKESKLFTLLVTPSLLEEPDGKPNYVMEHEYPAACDAGMDILPAEMEETDKDTLGEKYIGIPACINPHDEDAFRERLLNSISKIAVSASDDNPEHTFLIGLAYLDGIDVEVDRERGVKLITKAAEKELPEAMEKLYWMYDEGKYVSLNYSQAAFWMKKLVDYNTSLLGETHPGTLTSLSNLAYTYDDLGEYQRAMKLREQVYTTRCDVLGEEHPDTQKSLYDLASSYYHIGEYQTALEQNGEIIKWLRHHAHYEDPKWVTFFSLVAGNIATILNKLKRYGEAVELDEKIYFLRCDILGEEHPDTLTSLSNLAFLYEELGEHQKALEFGEKVYNIRCEVLGEDHPDTLISLYNLIDVYNSLMKYSKALELNEKLIEFSCKVVGEDHPKTRTFKAQRSVTLGLINLQKLQNTYETVEELGLYRKTDSKRIKLLKTLADTYKFLGNYKKYIEKIDEMYKVACSLFGENHINSLKMLNNLASAYYDNGDYLQAVNLFHDVYNAMCQEFGKNHPDTILSLNNVITLYGMLGEYQKKAELEEELYSCLCQINGETHPDTLTALSNLALTYEKLKNHSKELVVREKEYVAQCKILGEEHPETIVLLSNIALTYGELKDHIKEAELEEKVYKLRCRILGEEHPDTQISLNNLAVTYGELGEYRKKSELEEKLYTLRCRILGEEHPDTLTSLNNLAMTYSDLGDYKKALEFGEKLYFIRHQSIGEDHLQTLKALHNLAYYYGELGDVSKAIVLFEDVYVKKCKIMGETEKTTMVTLGRLSQTYARAGRYGEAVQGLEKVYAFRCDTLGADHPDTIKVKEKLDEYRKLL